MFIVRSEEGCSVERGSVHICVSSAITAMDSALVDVLMAWGLQDAQKQLQFHGVTNLQRLQVSPRLIKSPNVVTCDCEK